MIIQAMNDPQSPLRTLARAATALILLAVLLITGFQADAAETGGGTLCLAPVPRATTREITLWNAAKGERYLDAYAVQVDDRPVQALSQDKSMKLTGLDLKRRHRIRILNQGKVVESFFFRFSEHKTADLCLWLKLLYQSWSLSPAEWSGSPCSCGERRS
jgi:hypothetical protein